MRLVARVAAGMLLCNRLGLPRVGGVSGAVPVRLLGARPCLLCDGFRRVVGVRVVVRVSVGVILFRCRVGSKSFLRLVRG